MIPPTGDAYRAEALGAMIALAAKLDGSHNPAAGLATARDIRALLARADELLTRPGDTDALYDLAGAARDRIVKSLGTSAWEEPEKSKPLSLPASPRSDYTSEQQREGEAGLAKAVSELQPIAGGIPAEEPPLTDVEMDAFPATYDTRRLVAEVRRLRALLAENAVGDLRAAPAIDVARKVPPGKP